MVSSNKSRTFAVLLRKERLRAVDNRDVVQLVVYLVWDQGVARSSRVIPTNKGRLAQSFFVISVMIKKVKTFHVPRFLLCLFHIKFVSLH